MKSVKLSLVLATLLSGAYAANLEEALASGKISADVSAYYESRNQDTEISKYYSDTAYAVGSVGLAYTTGTLNNMSATVGFRGFTPLWEDDKNFNTGYGMGDANERFYNINSGAAIVSDAYIMYKDAMITAKVGRQAVASEFIGRIHDAVTMYVTPTKDLTLEFIYTQGQVKASFYELQKSTDKTEIAAFGGDGGLYKVGATYKFNPMVSAKLYAFEAPGAYNMLGGWTKLTFDSKVPFGLFAQYTTQDLDNTSLDYNFMKLEASTKIYDVTATLGYYQSGKNGFPQTKYNATGNDFEEGDQVFALNAKTPYIVLAKKFGDLDLSTRYGVTDYKKANGVSYDKSELNVIASYPITKPLSVKLWYTVTNEDEADAGTTDMQQISALLQYKF